jgi:hypothetical protein
MSRASSALLWKERREVGKALWLAPVAAGILFYEWVAEIDANAVTDPLEPSKWGLFILAGLALTIGYQQTARESSRDMWSFAFHRPVSASEIFTAKLLAGGVPLFVSMVVTGTLVMGAVSFARDLPQWLRWEYWPAAISDSLSVLGWYAAGLNLGAPGGRRERGYVGMGIAALGSFTVLFQHATPRAGMGMSAALTLVVLAMAYFGFTNGAELEADETPAIAGGRS